MYHIAGTTTFCITLFLLCDSVLHYVVMHCISLLCIVLYCIVLHCIAWRGIVFHCIALHCIALYQHLRIMAYCEGWTVHKWPIMWKTFHGMTSWWMFPIQYQAGGWYDSRLLGITLKSIYKLRIDTGYSTQKYLKHQHSSYEDWKSNTFQH